MNRKILEWIGLTLSLMIAGSSLFFMIGRVNTDSRDPIETYSDHVVIDYSDTNMFHPYIDQIIDSYNQSPEIADILFPNISRKSRNTMESRYDDAMALMGLENMETVTGLLGPSYGRSDMYGTGTGVVILNVEETNCYRYKAIPALDCPDLEAGEFIWTLVDANKQPLFLEDDFSESLQGSVELDPGIYFLYYDFDQLPDGINIKLIFN